MNRIFPAVELAVVKMAACLHVPFNTVEEILSNLVSQNLISIHFLLCLNSPNYFCSLLNYSTL